MNPKLLKSYAAKMGREASPRRKFTAAEAEAEIVRVITQVCKDLAAQPTYVFGYHAPEDIEQEAAFECVKTLAEGNYDASRPLENFLRVHVRNRMTNFKRNHLLRPEAPCQCCNLFDPPPEPCRRWTEWYARNSAKQNLMRPLDVAAVRDEGERNMRTDSSVYEEAEANELAELIDQKIPADLRGDYLRMRARVGVPKARRQRVREAVLEIMSA